MALSPQPPRPHADWIPMTNVQSQQWPVIDLNFPQPVLTLPDHLRRKIERLYTFEALDSARAEAYQVPDFHLARDRYIILSDAHKGDGHRQGDDFRHNEALYCAVLRHYLNEDYRLVLNGDNEEGWKSPLSAIMERYESTAFAVEREFARLGPSHYIRIYGNHDSDLSDPRVVDRHLKPVLGESVRVHAGMLLGNRILIAHGHQGDIDSDRRAWLSRRVVRYLWRPLQRVLHLRINHAAKHYDFHRRRDHFLHSWAQSNRMLLIAGHTHRPLFHPPDEHTANPIITPHYVNDGCCVHTDGLTGIEIDRGEMRLIRWQAGQTAPVKTVYQSTDLEALLARV